MNKKINVKLVADLALLARRYPSDDWYTIVDWLRNDIKRQELLLLLEELARVSKQVKRRQAHGKRRPSITQLLDELSSSEPEKAELLKDFHIKLLSKEILPTPKSLRIFSEIVGLKDIVQNKREQMVNEVIRHLSGFSYPEIQRALEQTYSNPSDFGRDYEHWVRLILGR